MLLNIILKIIFILIFYDKKGFNLILTAGWIKKDQIRSRLNQKLEDRQMDRTIRFVHTIPVFLVFFILMMQPAAPAHAQSIRKDRLIPVAATFSSLYVGSMAYLQFVWYKDKARVPFEFYNDSKGYKQIDKCGHMYGSYLESYTGFHSLLWSGVPRKQAIWYGGSMGFLMQLPIEIWDGMYEGWGFSWSDVGANFLGSALVISQELIFQDQPVKYKFSFSHSPYADMANGYLGDGFNELFYDYNGHTYWLTLGLNRIIPSPRIPAWIDLAFGYSAGGMFGEFKNKTSYHGVLIPETERHRQFLLSLDIDFSKIPVKNKFLRTVFDAMFLIKIPFPALEWNTKNQWILHPLYY